MKNMLRKLREDERGLTLVELLAVIVILAIVGAIAFVAIGNVIENSKKDAHVANALQVISAAKLYEAGGGEIGDGEEGSVSLSLEELDTIGELVDPWKKSEYELGEAKVTKSREGEDGEEKSVYSIQSFNADESKCNLTATEAQLREDGRKACNKNYTENN